jgi:Transposase zinc-binding domain
MSRPQLEVADIIRSAGADFVERNRHWLRWIHLKVLRAIARYRTAALGGHIDECTCCGHRATISYNTCRNRHCQKLPQTYVSISPTLSVTPNVGSRPPPFVARMHEVSALACASLRRAPWAKVPRSVGTRALWTSSAKLSREPAQPTRITQRTKREVNCFHSCTSICFGEGGQW